MMSTFFPTSFSLLPYSFLAQLVSVSLSSVCIFYTVNRQGEKPSIHQKVHNIRESH